MWSTCPCGLVYIGQTKRLQNMEYAMARHSAQDNHGSAASFNFLGIEKMSLSPRGGYIVNSLLRREAYWIHTQLNPLASCFL